MNIKSLLYLFLVLLCACRSDLPVPEEVLTYTPRIDSNVYIINEGNFGNGSGAISYYNSKTGVVVEDIFKQVNGRTIGNVCQSMTVVGNKGYIVVNNSQKVVVVSLPDFKEIGTVTGLTSPRYFLPISKDKAYITDLYSNTIAVVNLNNLSVTKHIPCYGSTEELLLFNGTAYVTNTRTDKIYLVNTDTDILEDSITVGFCSSSLRLDYQNNIWVYCTGDLTKKINAGLYKINSSENKMIANYLLPAPLNTWDRLEMNRAGDTLYFMNNGIYQMPVSADALSPKPLIAMERRQFYGLGVDPNTGEIYIADALDFNQQGIVYRYKKELNGQSAILVSKFSASVIPSDFVFYK